MAEGTAMRAIQVAFSHLGHRLFRNNVGLFTTKSGERVRTGLCKGSSDLIGFTGCCGRFLAVEVKSADGAPTIEQLDFLEIVNKHGGIGFIARSVDDAELKMKGHLCRTN